MTVEQRIERNLALLDNYWAASRAGRVGDMVDAAIRMTPAFGAVHQVLGQVGHPSIDISWLTDYFSKEFPDYSKAIGETNSVTRQILYGLITEAV